MRVGLIADIHGNLIALERVLDELKREPIDQLICLGDVAALGPHPHEVLERLRLLGCPVVLGNTDAWYLQPVPEDDEELAGIVQWGLQQFTDADLDYLRAFQPVIELPLDVEHRLLCYHGSPRSFNEVISSTTEAAELKDMFTGYRATILAGGHTHIQMLRRYEQGWLINPGSVGLPGVGPTKEGLLRNTDVHWAEYAIVTLHEGYCSVDLRRTPLDVSALLQDGYASGMPDIEGWVRLWRRPDQAV